ncbi:MAG: Crp/Fnr family transcriptional regulator [Chitinispirillaceae bacterium]
MDTMLTFTEVSQETLELYNRSKEIVFRIFEGLSLEGQDLTVRAGTDLFSEYSGSVIRVNVGMYKLLCGEKMIRFVGKGDLVELLPCVWDGFSLSSEFGSRVTVYPQEAFYSELSSQPPKEELLREYRVVQQSILARLAATFIQEDLQPDFQHKQFTPGQDIIKEGEHSSEIYQLVDGAAVVTVKGTEVGEVSAGEIFGELSFLTSSIRTATVTAKRTCIVQSMTEQEFLKLSRLRPRLVLEMSKTLAKRLVNVNNKLSDVVV